MFAKNYGLLFAPFSFPVRWLHTQMQ